MSEIVKVGQVSIPVHRRGDGRWFFKRKVAGQWRTVASVDKAKIVAEAKETARLIGSQRSDLLAARPDEYAEFLEWKARTSGVTVREALTEYQAAKLSSEMSPQHRRSIEGLTKRLAPVARYPINDVRASDIDAVLRELSNGPRKVGPRRRNNVRDDLIAFFRWCRKREYLPEGQTAPERTDRLAEPHPRKEFFTVAEFRKILAASDDAWIPWLVIGAFAGLRSEEIQRLDWSRVLLNRGMIDVLAETSKTRRRRLVPISENLAKWLATHAKESGPVIANRIDHNIAALRNRLKIKWPDNGLRHSFGSYRLALTQNAAQLAEEMGNSVQMIRRHYAEAVFPTEAKEWFSIAPKRTKLIVLTSRTGT